MSCALISVPWPTARSGSRPNYGSMPRTAAAKGRPVPRPFEFHRGKGQITAEASFTGKYTEPVI
jgi:hypothetical protein